MTSPTVTAKLHELRHRLDRIAAHAPADEASLANDEDRLDLVSFNLMLAVQVCVDIAAHLVSELRLAPARTNAELMHRLRDHGILDAASCEAVIRATSFRNVVAHAYGRIDTAMTYRAATEGLRDLERFAELVLARG